MKKLNVAIIGYKFMGKAHSNAWRKAPYFFDLNAEPVLKVACGRHEASLKEFADPLLPKKLLNDDQKSVNWCTLCMDCGMLLGEQQEVGCSVYDRYYREMAKKIKEAAQ